MGVLAPFFLGASMGRPRTNPIVKDPVARSGAYVNQKPIHPTDISFREATLGPDQEIVLQVNGRTVLYPVFKLVSTIRGNMWTDAIGDLEIFYDENIVNVYIRNVSNCTYKIKFKIV
jgi:hypothetical protein